jgi:hypothetical protein
MRGATPESKNKLALSGHRTEWPRIGRAGHAGGVRPCTAAPLIFGMATDLPPHRLGIVQTDPGPVSMQTPLWGAPSMVRHKNTITHRLPPRAWGNFAVVVSTSVWHVANAQASESTGVIGHLGWPDK